VLGSLENFVLDLHGSIQELIAATGHPDDQVATLLGVLLGVA
jgi:hypothetical protein